MAINRELQPLDMGGIFSTTLELYRDNVALFIGIVAILEIPEAILSFLVQVASPTPVTTSGGKIHFNGGALAGSLALNGGLALLGLVFGALITGALARAIAARYLGRTISIGQAYASIGTSTFVTLVAASILEGIVVGVGFIVFVLPGIFLLVRLLFIPQAVVLERKSIFGAFDRSWQLVSGSWWRVFGIGLVLFLIVAVISGVIGGIAGSALALGHGAGGHAASTGIDAIVGIILQPFQLGALTVLYYDLRVRKEGFGVDHLATDLGSV